MTAFVAFRRIGAEKGLGLAVYGQNAVAQSQLAVKCKLHEGAGAFVRNDLEMISFAADDAAKRDCAVKWALFGFGNVKYDRHGKWDFERAGHAHNFIRSTGFLESGFRPRAQQLGDCLIKPRLDNEEARACEISLKGAWRPVWQVHAWILEKLSLTVNRALPLAADPGGRTSQAA